mgnify:CR=1 FL=1
MASSSLGGATAGHGAGADETGTWTGQARRACERYDVQWLDQAVALRKLGLRWTHEGLRLRRHYRVEFSEEGTGRRDACLILLGLRLELLDMGIDERPDCV